MAYTNEQLRHLQNKTLQFVKPGVLLTHTTVDSTAGNYKSQLSTFQNNCAADTMILNQYGFSSCPLAGSHAISLAVQGDNTQNVIIGTHDNRWLPRTLQAGEVSLYDYQGQSINLQQNQVINVTSQKTVTFNIGSDTQVTITDGSILITGDVEIQKDLKVDGNITCSGSITADGDIKAGGISLKEHTHTVTAAPGTTGAPQ